MIHHKGLFEKYRDNKKYFVETGTYLGLGVQLALEAGYEFVSSVELAPQLYERAKEMFKNDARVKLYKGTSEENLWEMIANTQEEILFWLDAHYAGETGCIGPEKSPIIKELEIIKKHNIKTHTILIDDVRNMGTEHFGMISKYLVIEKILEINPNYSITYEDGSIDDKTIFPKDIMVASI